MKIEAEQLIREFERMQREHWAYEWGAAKEGCVDCSGAFVYAFRGLNGPAIYHGSNTIFRQSIGKLTKTPHPGYAAFKVRLWTEKEAGNRWAGQQPGDVYHIGLVDGSGEWVLNAKSTQAGFSRDRASGFHWFAPLLAVDYGEERKHMERIGTAEVVTKSDALAIREDGSGTAKKIGSAPKGAMVDVYQSDGGWWKVGYGGITGYASAAYLKMGETEAVGFPEERTTLINRDSGMKIALIGRWDIENN